MLKFAIIKAPNLKGKELHVNLRELLDAKKKEIQKLLMKKKMFINY
jgi:hypothetical protein